MNTERFNVEHLDDESLTNALSSSDWGSALAVLWDRHAGLLYSAARAVCRADDDARDAISDALANIAQRAADGTLQITSSFKAYAAIVVRNAALNTIRRTGRVDVSDDIDLDTSAGGPSFLPDPVVDDLETSFVATAFASLPERYRQVLWLTEVEGLPPREVADIVGLSANNVSQIAVRARTALREGWAAAHLTGRDIAIGCGDFVSQLPALVSGTLRTDRLNALEDHLSACVDCGRLRSDLMDDTVKLRSLALPIPLVILFDHLRRSGGAASVGGAATAASTATSVTIKTAAGIGRRALTTFTQTVSQMNQVLLIGLGTVAAVSLVGAGVLVVTTRDGGDTTPIAEATTMDADTGSAQDSAGGDASSPSDGDAIPVDGDEPATDQSVIDDETETTPDDNDPTDMDTDPIDRSGESTQETSPPAQQPIVILPIDFGGSFPATPPTNPPIGSITGDRILTVGQVIPAGQSLSWTYQASGDTPILARATAGTLRILSPQGTNIGSCYFGCRLPTAGTYTITLDSFNVNGIPENVPATAQLLLAIASPLTPNQPIAIDEDLPWPLGRGWSFQGQANQVVAFGKTSQTGFMNIRAEQDISVDVCLNMNPCILPESDTYYLYLIGGSGNQSPTPAGTLIELATAAGQTLLLDEPQPLGRELLAGMYRLYSFNATAGQTILPNMEYRRSGSFTCFGESFTISPTGQIINNYSGPMDIATSGVHTIAYRISFFPDGVGCGNIAVPAEHLVEVAGPSGTLEFGVPVDVNKVRPPGLHMFWEINIPTPQLVRLFGTSSVTTWYEGSRPPYMILFGPNGRTFESLSPIDADSGRHFVAVSSAIASTEIIIGNQPQTIGIAVPFTFSGTSAEFASTIWQFEATAGQIVDGQGFIFSSQQAPFSRNLVELESAFFDNGCPCEIPADGTYYFLPYNFGGSLSTTDTRDEVLSITEYLGALVIDEPSPLPQDLLPEGRYFWTVSGTDGQQIQLPLLPGGVYLTDNSGYLCTGTCTLPSNGVYLLVFDNGFSLVPAGTSILINSIGP